MLLTSAHFTHLKTTFDHAAKAHPNLLEPFVTLLGDAYGQDEQTHVMWAGLRDTIKQRFPRPQPQGPAVQDAAGQGVLV